MKALNPFAFILERRESRYYDLNTKPVYKNGEYATYKYVDRYYVTCRGNIIVSETSGIPKDLIEALVAGQEPDDYSKHRYRRMIEAYNAGLQFAKKVNFAVMP